MLKVQRLDNTLFRFHLVTSNSDPKTPPNSVLERGFYQCVIVMVDDPARNMLTPVYFVLCTSKTETMYEDVLQLINRDTDKKMTPAEVVRDFEFSLISSVQQQFPNAEVVGCFFHFKQALLRRMKHEHITEPEMKIAMEPGVLDVLTVIDPDLTDPKGIAWVKLEIKKRCAAKYCVYSNHERRTFWSYFRRTWLERYFVMEWNVFGIANSVVARTNNPLERLNWEMNAVFKPHPNLRQFLRLQRCQPGTREESKHYKASTQKKTRAPRIDLLPAPDLTGFVVPPASDDEDVREDSHSSTKSLCSEVQDGLNGDLSSDDEILNNGESAEDLEQEITENADTYDFSFDWDGDSESDSLSETDY
ncbi:LOW QUALITY PROTEIN: putative cleavage induced protein [Phytophthora megakarya]|uniref:Putative cleavage induced protein n=1 Tax=Phytophthora megakarya TaxID=4795 RepID=A0A225W6V5_9STRA|nr:LOW QUALITY PROTEIN: putative cleavage induced protein [Phytophthora megakarya]